MLQRIHAGPAPCPETSDHKISTLLGLGHAWLVRDCDWSCEFDIAGTRQLLC